MRIKGFVIACSSLVLLSGVCLGQDKVQVLITAVQGQNAAIRQKAIDQLGNLGVEAKAAIPALIQALQVDDEESRWRVGRALGAMGEDGQDAVPALVKALQDESPRVKAYVAHALGRIGDDSAIDGLVSAALDKDVFVRRACFRALRQINAPIEKTLPIIVAVLDGADPSVILPALHTLAEQGAEAVPRLRKALENEGVSYWACIVLADIGEDAAPAVPELRKVVLHEDPDTQLQALLALGEIGKASDAALPEILQALKDSPFDHVKIAAAYALARIKPSGSEADSALKMVGQTDHEMLKMVVAWARAKLNPKDVNLTRQAIDLIVAGLKSDDNDVQAAAARALVELEGPSEIVAPALVAALQDDDPSVVGNAVEALAAQGTKALPGIKRALGNPKLRGFATRILYRIGPDAAAAVPELIGAIRDAEDDPEFRREAHFTLAAIGSGAVEAVPQLIESVKTGDFEVCGSAIYVLGKIGPEAEKAVPALVEVFQGDDELLQRVAIWALLNIRPDNKKLAKKAVPFMIKSLSSEREIARIEAALMLGKIGNVAKSEAIEPLKKALEDPSESVRKAAEQALQQLQ